MDRPLEGYTLTGICLYNRFGKLLKDGDIEGLKCVSCFKLLRNPFQLIECGHRCCQCCLHEVVLKRVPCICPEETCGESIKEGDVRPDKGCLKEIQSLTVSCNGDNCSWSGKIADLEDHLATCPHAKVECPEKCGQFFTKNQLSNHQNQCPNRAEKCQYCNKVLPKGTSRESHYSSCQMIPEFCIDCKKPVPRAKLSQHRVTNCSEMQSSCSFEGCTQKGKIGELNEHYKEHMHELVSKMNSVIANMSSVLLENAALQQKVSVMESKLKESEVEVTLLRLQVNEMPNLQKQLSVIEKDLRSLSMKGPPLVSVDSGFRSGIALDGKDETSYSTFGSGSSGYGSGSSGSYGSYSGDDLRSAVRRLENDVAIIKPTIDNFSQLHAQIVGYMETVQTVQESVTRHAVAMEEIKLRQDILDVKTTHGIFIWKIPEIERRYRDAQERRTLSLYSPPFHTSPHGYRMCIRAYLNGDGSGKGTYISVFFVLMKSEHDNLLQWPFRRPVTFQLLNQENPSLTVSETFMPDTQSPSFQQPKSEMNIASGFPRFAKQSCLKDPSFTKGDAIFIRCKIDLTGMEKLE